MDEHPAPEQSDLEHDLADLRYTWGGAYRITWQSHFLATHIVSGEMVVADTAAALDIDLRDNFCKAKRLSTSKSADGQGR